MIDAAVRDLVEQARRQAVDTLTRERRTLDRVAAALLEHETITAEAWSGSSKGAGR